MKKALWKKWLGGATSLVFAFAALAFCTSSMAAQAPATARTVAPESEVCKGCHASYVESYLTTKHGQQGNQKGPDCQSCHTNALEHAKAGGGKKAGGIFGFGDKKVPAEKKSAVCMNCHEGNRHLAFWESGKHKKGDVSCNSCHVMHGTPGAGSTIALAKNDPTIAPYQTTQRQLQYETCTSCHKQIRSQLLKPSHHPIIEGRMACTSCHNPHGALSNAMINSESVHDLCTGCHAEKRGPFVWGHPPVEENCLTCHNSHGSNHTRLLAQNAPNVCQDCHDAAQHPGSVYDAKGGWTPIPNWNSTPGAVVPNTRLIARGCINCHYTIHGSNAPARNGKFFLR